MQGVQGVLHVGERDRRDDHTERALKGTVRTSTRCGAGAERGVAGRVRAVLGAGVGPLDWHDLQHRAGPNGSGQHGARPVDHLRQDAGGGGQRVGQVTFGEFPAIRVASALTVRSTAATRSATKSLARKAAPATRPTARTAVATMVTRARSDRLTEPRSGSRRVAQPVARAAYRLEPFPADLASQVAGVDLDRVGVAVSDASHTCSSSSVLVTVAPACGMRYSSSRNSRRGQVDAAPSTVTVRGGRVEHEGPDDAGRRAGAPRHAGPGPAAGPAARRRRTAWPGSRRRRGRAPSAWSYSPSFADSDQDRRPDPAAPAAVRATS